MFFLEVGKVARILVVDDDRGIREMLRQFLEKVKYEVLVASDGKEALQLLKDQPADLMITDIVMPEKEGLETIMECRRLSPGIKIIAISGGRKIGEKDYLNVARALGAEKTLLKPFGLKGLLDAVQELLGTS
jgi:DNA-binding response OmpR family regulator